MLDVKHARRRLADLFVPGNGLMLQPLRVGNKSSGAAAIKRASKRLRNIRARAAK